MKIIGVTGSSGSGKTTICEILEKNENIKIINCDEIARKISVPGNEYLEKIKEEFGDNFFDNNGALNRKLLADCIYNNENSLNKLNNLTFKYVVREVLKEIENLKAINEIKYIIIDAPLLFESGLNEKCDYIITIVADENIKINRICKRDKIDIDTAKKRLNIQKRDEFYKEKSNFVIENNDNTNLEIEINNILKNIEGKL